MRFMKRLLAALTLIFGLWIVPAIAAEECGGRMSFTETMEAAKEIGMPMIVIQGEGLDKWDKEISKDDGPVKPAELVSLVVPAELVKAALNGETNTISFATFIEDGCPYKGGVATFRGAFVVDALKAALGIEDAGI